MHLGRSVLAGLVAGAVAGFLVALLRPRETHPAAPMSSGFLTEDAPLTETARDDAAHPLTYPPLVAPAEASLAQGVPDTATPYQGRPAPGWEPAGSVPGASRRSASGDGDTARTPG